MIKRIARLAIAATAYSMALSTSPAQTSSWAIDPTHSSVEFQIKHLGVSNVRGALTGIKGNVLLDEKDFAKSTVEANIDANTVNTSNEARDKHLKSPEFFDVAKYPTLAFKSVRIVDGGGKKQIVGDLTLGGVTRGVTLDLDGPAPAQKGMRGGLVSGFSATGTLKRSDFNFSQKYAPPMLGDEIKFTIDVEIDKP